MEDVMDRPWLKYYEQTVPENFIFPETTLDRIFMNTVAKYPGWIACTYNDEDITYQQLNERVNRFAHGLISLGVKKGDHVALMLPTSPAYPIAAEAIHKLGAVIVNIGVMTKGNDFTAIFRASGAKILLTLDIFLQNIHMSLAGAGVEHLILHSVFGLEKKLLPLQVDFIYLDKLNAGQSTDEIVSASAPDDLALLQMTSGTSGRPKAVMLTHRNIVSNLYQIESFRPQVTPNNGAVICMLPFFHVFGFAICFQLSVFRGYRMVLVPRFDPFAVLPIMGMLEKYKPVSLPAVPGLWGVLTRHLEDKPGRAELLSSIEMPTSGGAYIQPSVKERFYKITGRHIHEAYGLSEASSTTHMTPLTRVSPPGSIGIPIPGTDAKITDINDPDKKLETGMVGELAIFGPQIMKGYWNLPEETESTARVRNGWLYTGDLARMDEDGFFYIVDRKDDMIIISGFNVYPSEIESVLKNHSGVADAVVIGVKDSARGQFIEARVVLREGESTTQSELLEHCRTNLADYKIPRRILIVKDIPKSPVGKPLRRELRNQTEEK
jgi:long-chain acyl-CoA synthetase